LIGGHNLLLQLKQRAMFALHPTTLQHQ